MENNNNSTPSSTATNNDADDARLATHDTEKEKSLVDVIEHNENNILSDANFVQISLPTPRQRSEQAKSAAADKEKAARAQREAAARNTISVAEDLRRLRLETHSAYVKIKGNIQLRQTEKHQTPRETEQQRFTKAIKELRERDAKEKEAEKRFEEIRNGWIDDIVILYQRQIRERNEELLESDRQKAKILEEEERLRKDRIEYEENEKREEKEKVEAAKREQERLRENYRQERIEMQNEIHKKRVHQWKAEDREREEEAARMRERSHHIAEALEELHEENERRPQPPRRFLLQATNRDFELQAAATSTAQSSIAPQTPTPHFNSLIAPTNQATQQLTVRRRMTFEPNPNQDHGHLGGIALSHRPPRRPQGAPSVASFIAARPPTTTVTTPPSRPVTATPCTRSTRVIAQFEERRLLDGTWGPRSLDQFERMRELQGRPIDPSLREPKRVQLWVDHMLVKGFWQPRSEQQRERLAKLQPASSYRNQ